MSKIITFSRVFPAYHPKAGYPTNFVEKIWKGLWDTNKAYDIHLFQEPYDNHFHPMGNGIINVHQFKPKFHTIRSGKRWKVGDKFSPRVWSGKPYQSKQIVIAPDLEVKKTFKFEIKNGIFFIDEKIIESCILSMVIKNDGLTYSDFFEWFKYPQDFSGQIICWNDKISY